MGKDLRLIIEPVGDAQGRSFVAQLKGDETFAVEFDLPVAVDDMDDLLVTVQSSLVSREARSRKAGRAVDIQQLGTQLFQTLFQGEIRAKLDRAVHEFGDTEPVRIMIEVGSTGANEFAPLLRLPWEAAFCIDQHGPLSLSERMTLFRYLDVGFGYKPLRTTRPVRVLVAMSNPIDLPQLNLAAERSRIETTWANLDGVHVDFLEHASMPSLTAQLGQHEYHVLHFMGHGAFDETLGEGLLVFENSDGTGKQVPGRDLAREVWHEETIQLVFLNACNTGQSSERVADNFLAGVAPAMVATGGVPAVIAMQFPISDNAAIRFAEEVYGGVVSGRPVDVAVAKGRRVIALQDPRSHEWITPVLYMRSLDGQLFDFAT